MPTEPRWDAVTGSNVVVRNSTGGPVVLRGKTLTDLEIWRLARALDGTEVEIQRSQPANPEVKYILIGTSKNEAYSSSSYHKIELGDDSSERFLQLHNRGYYLIDNGVRGRAWAAVALQAATAHRLGFERIKVFAQGHSATQVAAAQAAGSPPLTHRVGIIQWPKLGFDAPIPDNFFTYFPNHQLQSVGVTVGDWISKLMLTKQGQDLWKTFAISLSMALTMELYPMSVGAQNLLTWVAKRPRKISTDGQ